MSEVGRAHEPTDAGSRVRSFIYSVWGYAGDDRVKPALAALEALQAERDLARRECNEVYAVNAASANDRADALAARLAAVEEALREDIAMTEQSIATLRGCSQELADDH